MPQQPKRKRKRQPKGAKTPRGQLHETLVYNGQRYKIDGQARIEQSQHVPSKRTKKRRERKAEQPHVDASQPFYERRPAPARGPMVVRIDGGNGFYSPAVGTSGGVQLSQPPVAQPVQGPLGTRREHGYAITSHNNHTAENAVTGSEDPKELMDDLTKFELARHFPGQYAAPYMQSLTASSYVTGLVHSTKVWNSVANPYGGALAPDKIDIGAQSYVVIWYSPVLSVFYGTQTGYTTAKLGGLAMVSSPTDASVLSLSMLNQFTSANQTAYTMSDIYGSQNSQLGGTSFVWSSKMSVVTVGPAGAQNGVAYQGYFSIGSLYDNGTGAQSNVSIRDLIRGASHQYAIAERTTFDIFGSVIDSDFPPSAPKTFQSDSGSGVPGTGAQQEVIGYLVFVNAYQGPDLATISKYSISATFQSNYAFAPFLQDAFIQGAAQTMEAAADGPVIYQTEWSNGPIVEGKRHAIMATDSSFTSMSLAESVEVAAEAVGILTGVPQLAAAAAISRAARHVYSSFSSVPENVTRSRVKNLRKLIRAPGYRFQVRHHTARAPVTLARFPKPEFPSRLSLQDEVDEGPRMFNVATQLSLLVQLMRIKQHANMEDYLSPAIQDDYEFLCQASGQANLPWLRLPSQKPASRSSTPERREPLQRPMQQHVSKRTAA